MSQNPQYQASQQPYAQQPPMVGPPPGQAGAYPPPGQPGVYPPPPGYAPPPGYVQGYPPPGYPPQQLGSTSYPPGFYGQNGMSPEQAAKAKKLVTISTICGWGGLLVAIFGSIIAGVAFNSGAAAGVVAVLGIIVCVFGAIVGQVGRGMQGRVI
jgi:hypothetical protein